MKGIRYVSLFEPSGYGESARRYVLGLAKLDVPITWSPMVPGRGWGLGYEPFEGRSVGDPELDPYCNRPIEYDVVVLHLVPEYYPRWAQIERKKITAYTVWETDQLPRNWASLLQNVDLVLVPSEWNRRTFREGGVKAPVEVVPHCLPFAMPPIAPSNDNEEFVFYSINVWSDRKALDLTLRAYRKAFRRDDPVRLILKTSSRHLSFRLPFTGLYPIPTHWLISRSRLGRQVPKLTALTELVSNAEIRELHAGGHCYVSLCRSEGWGMGAFDAAASGRPVIMTGYGGQCDFLPPDLAYLVNYSTVRTPWRMTKSFQAHHWAEPDVRHGAELMRHVFENRSEAQRRGLELAGLVRERFSSDSIARTFLDRLHRHFS